ncbi:MAG: tetratricopeptide repeat protein [Acidobacteriaceae bacterium]|nr:tetratricopeptide repeat protein [Acidobacteriaceae bacterium]
MTTICVYAQVRHFDFINYDDPADVSLNHHVRNGITLETVLWAVTSVEESNWFPAVRLSHLLDYQLFGLRSGFHHLTNVLLHSIAAVLLFVFLNRATHDRWPSVFVAFVFALHPLHVESVAWITERKDVLSALFWFLTLWAYVRYVEQPRFGRYLLVLLSFCVALMSKPMAVTLPLLLLLLDVWPLQRISPIGSRETENKRRLVRMIREKVPLFAASAASAVITYFAQQKGGAVATLARFPVVQRFENALISYVAYIFKMLWPAHLAVFYPFPHELSAWQAATAGLMLTIVSIVVFRSVPARPFRAVGWFWYLITLIPVIGLLQVGEQARADRYMYVPMVGLSILIAWGVRDVLRTWPVMKIPVLIVAAAALLACTAATLQQLQYWQNSETLFRHALDVTNDNYVAHANLGAYLVDKNERIPEAISHLQAALRIQPQMVTALDNLGIAFSEAGRPAEGIPFFEKAVQLRPDSPLLHTDFGNALAKIPTQVPAGIAQYQAAVELDASYPQAHNNLGAALAKIQGRLSDAIAEYTTAIQLEPDYAEAHNNLCAALVKVPGRLSQGIAECETAVKLKPDYAEAYNNLGIALSQTPERLHEAISQYEEAVRLTHSFPEAQYNLGNALMKTGRVREAIPHFESALRTRPDYANAHYSLAFALLKTGATGAAMKHFETGLHLRPDPALEKLLNQLRNGRM